MQSALQVADAISILRLKAPYPGQQNFVSLFKVFKTLKLLRTMLQLLNIKKTKKTLYLKLASDQNMSTSRYYMQQNKKTSSRKSLFGDLIKYIFAQQMDCAVFQLRLKNTF